MQDGGIAGAIWMTVACLPALLGVAFLGGVLLASAAGLLISMTTLSPCKTAGQRLAPTQFWFLAFALASGAGTAAELWSHQYYFPIPVCLIWVLVFGTVLLIAKSVYNRKQQERDEPEN